MECIRPAAPGSKFRRVVERVSGGMETGTGAGSGGWACSEANRFHIKNSGRDSGGCAFVDFLVSEREHVRSGETVRQANVAQVLRQPWG